MSNDTIVRRVFIIERPKPGIDISAAEAYGPLVVVHDPTGHGEKRRSFPSVFNMTQYGRSILSRLEEERFDADADYIMATGSAIVVSLTYAVLALKYRMFNVLVYNANESTYIEKTFDGDAILTKGDTSCLG